MLELTDKVALISGAARGQGAAEARLFAQHGARVAVADIAEAPGRAVAAELGGAGAFVPLDCTSETSWERAVDAALDRFGRLDILVNNAGISAPGTIATTTLDEYLRLIMVNQVGVFLGMKAALRGLRVRGGAIVNIASVSGNRGTPAAFGYGATKWAVRGMTKSAAREFAPLGIRVNSVHPSVVDTEMVAEQLKTPWRQQVIDATPLGRIATVDDVAKTVLFLASDASSYYTGAEFVLDGGRLC
jgi:3alpha(or 20beta)-hydroxysteroid dehydrogenase